MCAPFPKDAYPFSKGRVRLFQRMGTPCRGMYTPFPKVVYPFFVCPVCREMCTPFPNDGHPMVGSHTPDMLRNGLPSHSHG